MPSYLTRHQLASALGVFLQRDVTGRFGKHDSEPSPQWLVNQKKHNRTNWYLEEHTWTYYILCIYYVCIYILCPTPMLIGFSAFHFAFSCLVHKTSQRSHWQGSFHSFMNIYEHHLNMEANPLSHHLKVVLKCLECPYIGLFKIEHPKIVRWIIRATIHSPTLSWTSAK